MRGMGGALQRSGRRNANMRSHMGVLRPQNGLVGVVDDGQ